FLSEDATHPPDLWLAESAFRAPRQLTHLNPQLDRYRMGSARLISWLSDDGTPLRGAVLLPPHYEEGNRYPLLVWLCPKLRWNELCACGFGEFPSPWNMQLFATRGYVVLFPDIPAIKPMNALAKAVLPGVNKLVELGIADPERLGTMGHSQGGTAVMALI